MAQILGVHSKTGVKPFLVYDKIDVPYTQIKNRAQIPDLANDLSANMGIKRIRFFDTSINVISNQLTDEFGPNGEPVYRVTNDPYDQIRIVNPDVQAPSGDGQVFGWNSADGFMEVTFYGTGLNLLWNPVNNGSQAAITLDGVSQGTISFPIDYELLRGRGDSINVPINMVKGLTLGLHTIKIEKAGAANLRFSGIEIVTESSNVSINPGSYSNEGMVHSLNAQHSHAYDSVKTGTKGGRVLDVLKGNSIQTLWTPVDTTAKYLSNTDHSNEEIVRSYHFREFGIGRSDDFQSLYGSVSNRYYTLDDGTTTLMGIDVFADAGKGMLPNPNQYWRFTFVGTGLDLYGEYYNNTGSAQIDIAVDGTTVGNFPSGLTEADRKLYKICSGLPYGMHTVQLTRGASGQGLTVFNFVVYGPKKPEAPEGAVVVADYNLMADFDTSGMNSALSASNPLGTLFKSPLREHQYTDTTWAASAFNANFRGGRVTSVGGNTGETVELTFFGTGAYLRAMSGSNGVNLKIYVDGVAYTGSATLISSGSWSPSTSTWDVATNWNTGLYINGLSLGIHKIKLEVTTNTDTWYWQGMDIITPIHSHAYSLSNYRGLAVGSQGILDNRNIDGPNKSKTEGLLAAAFGTQTSVTTTATSHIPMQGMIAGFYLEEDMDVELDFNFSFNSSNAINAYTAFQVDGVQITSTYRQEVLSVSQVQRSFMNTTVRLTKGYHIAMVTWFQSGGTLNLYGSQRELFVKKA